ncbi:MULTISPECIES: hypothetical protein [Serratia]|uniref:DUF7948 domain-containing protein n=1 Tax=Serratia TaxID=613 RepID=UPI000F0B1A5C|nr:MULTISPECIES: hypothetical protein [Serratia]AYU89948.1 hypothetical protein EDY99_06170 [Serratia sp. LS-1]MBH2559321.1 hypothetical protein [Serratia ureilytica]
MNFRSSQCMLTGLALALLPGLWAGAVPKPGTAQVQQALQGLATPFEANNGQFDKRVAFMGRTFAGPVYVTRTGRIVYSMPGWSLSETLVDARALNPYGGEQAATQVSRFTGPKSYQAATYRNVMLGQAWPGIEVELAARGSNVEKLFHVKPHADVDRIQVRLAGAESLRLGEAGELIATTGHGDIAYTAPVAFQMVGGKHLDVPVKYVLNEAGDGDGFELGMYDRTRPLVIDPLLQSTYLGGTGTDAVHAIAIDAASGDVLVGGETQSASFPGVEGGAQPAFGGYRDAFVARLSGDLTTLRQASYLGGDGYDYIQALAIDADTGDVVVGGFTNSTNFPASAGGAQARGGGGDDGFVARMSGDLKVLQQSSYLGGIELDRVYAVAIDAATGDVLVGGASGSANFPGVQGGAQSIHGGGDDAFVARMSGDLKILRQSSYLGGNGSDQIYALAIDAATGDVLAAGQAAASPAR